MGAASIPVLPQLPPDIQRKLKLKWAQLIEDCGFTGDHLTGHESRERRHQGARPKYTLAPPPPSDIHAMSHYRHAYYGSDGAEISYEEWHAGELRAWKERESDPTIIDRIGISESKTLARARFADVAESYLEFWARTNGNADDFVSWLNLITESVVIEIGALWAGQWHREWFERVCRHSVHADLVISAKGWPSKARTIELQRLETRVRVQELKLDPEFERLLREGQQLLDRKPHAQGPLPEFALDVDPKPNNGRTVPVDGPNAPAKRGQDLDPKKLDSPPAGESPAPKVVDERQRLAVCLRDQTPARHRGFEADSQLRRAITAYWQRFRADENLWKAGVAEEAGSDAIMGSVLVAYDLIPLFRDWALRSAANIAANPELLVQQLIGTICPDEEYGIWADSRAAQRANDSAADEPAATPGETELRTFGMWEREVQSAWVAARANMGKYESCLPCRDYDIHEARSPATMALRLCGPRQPVQQELKRVLTAALSLMSEPVSEARQACSEDGEKNRAALKTSPLSPEASSDSQERSLCHNEADLAVARTHRASTVAKLIKELDALKPQMFEDTAEYDRLAITYPSFLVFKIAEERQDLKMKIVAIRGSLRHIRLAQELAAAHHGRALTTIQSDWKLFKPAEFRRQGRAPEKPAT